ncbi:hypothetical protein MBLNU230_g4371t1 [Neophaeotheca triangularis]
MFGFYSMYLSGTSAQSALPHLNNERRKYKPFGVLLTTPPSPTHTGLCERRQWPDPSYESYTTRQGHFCKVRVNNREYCTDVPYQSDVLAREGAATKAWMICRNFSVNDGMYPGQRAGQRSDGGIVQGLPAPIGTGRRSNRDSNSSSGGYTEPGSGESSSGGDSPKSLDSGFEQQMQLPMPPPPPPQQQQQQQPSRTARRSQRGGDQYPCLCRRAPVRAYGRCNFCLRENGWA